MRLLKKLSKDTAAEVYYAGECARDIIRRRKSNEVEVVVRNISLAELVSYIKPRTNKIRISKAKGCINFPLADGGNMAISLPKRGNTFNPSYSLRDDAKSRDFSINAMYVPVRSGHKRKIIDFYQGRTCIKQRRIETISKASVAVQKNPLIMMKAITFAAKLSYRIDNNLFYAIKANQDQIEKAPVEDVRDAFIAILLSNKPSKYLQLMHKCGLLDKIIPELGICIGIAQNEKYHKYDVFNHCLIACDYTEPDLIIRLAALLHDVGKPQTAKEAVKDGVNRITFYNHEVMGSKIARKILRRLKFEKKIVSTVSALIYNHMYNYEPAKWSGTAVKRFISKAHVYDADLDNLSEFPLFLLRKADRAANGRHLSEISPRQYALEQRIKETIERSKKLAIADLAISGTDIMEEFNLKPGPTIGHILSYLFSIVIEDHRLNKKDILIDEASKYLSEALK